MYKKLKKINREEVYYYNKDGIRIEGLHNEIYGDASGIYGDVSGLRGSVDEISGNVSGLHGDVSGLRGNVNELCGDVDECGITAEERKNGVKVEELIQN